MVTRKQKSKFIHSCIKVYKDEVISERELRESEGKPARANVNSIFRSHNKTVKAGINKYMPKG